MLTNAGDVSQGFSLHIQEIQKSNDLSIISLIYCVIFEVGTQELLSSSPCKMKVKEELYISLKTNFFCIYLEDDDEDEDDIFLLHVPFFFVFSLAQLNGCLRVPYFFSGPFGATISSHYL